MLQLNDVIKHPVRQQLPEAGPQTNLPKTAPMGRCQQPNPRSGNLTGGLQLRFAPQLVHRHHLGIHHPQQQRHPLVLGAAGEHIGAGAQIQGVFPLSLGSQLPALIHYPDSYALGAQLANEIPKERGLSAPGRR